MSAIIDLEPDHGEIMSNLEVILFFITSLMGLLNLLLVYVLNNIRDQLKDIRTDMNNLRSCDSKLSEQIGNCLTRPESQQMQNNFYEAIHEVMQKLDRIYDKLDGKADKARQ